VLTRVVDGAGLQIGNTALSSYIVDSYYEHAMDIITFYTVIINVSPSPYSNPYHQTDISIALSIRGAVVHQYLGRGFRYVCLFTSLCKAISKLMLTPFRVYLVIRRPSNNLHLWRNSHLHHPPEIRT
jgi:hypothetical protein